MLRPATRADLPHILEIRDSGGAERLYDARSMADTLARQLIDTGAVQVWQAPAEPLAGFVALDTASGAIVALLVAPGQQGRGIGRALLAAACDALRAAGRATATIALEPGSPAERHYRAAGWSRVSDSAAGQIVLSKDLA